MFFVLDMLEILIDTLRGRTEFGKKRDENRAFAEHYIEDDACAVKILFDLRFQISTNVTPNINSTNG